MHDNPNDHKVHDDHHDGIDGISADLRRGRGTQHDGCDKDDLDYQHGDREDEGTVGFTQAFSQRVGLFQHAKGTEKYGG